MKSKTKQDIFIHIDCYRKFENFLSSTNYTNSKESNYRASIIIDAAWPKKIPKTQSWIYCPLINAAIKEAGLNNKKHLNKEQEKKMAVMEEKHPHYF